MKWCSIVYISINCFRSFVIINGCREKTSSKVIFIGCGEGIKSSVCEAWKSWRRALWELPKGQAILKGKYSVNHNSKIGDIPIICAVDSKSSN